MKQRTLLFFIVVVLFLSACGPNVEVVYSPPGIPIQISVNASGQIDLEFSTDDFATPFGTIGFKAGMNLYSLASEYSEDVLIVRVDDEVTIYELEEGKRFYVTFDDSNMLYKKVSLTHEVNGDIILELESVEATVEGRGLIPVSGDPQSSCSGAPPQRLEINEDARVCTNRDRVYLREGPSKNYDILEKLYPNTVVWVDGGPVCADDWSWWHVETLDGITGWMSEGGDEKDDYFLCPN